MLCWSDFFSLRKKKKAAYKLYFHKQKRHYKFFYALRRYGLKKFKWEVLCENISEDDIDWYETWFIVTFDSKVNGYNSTFGGIEEKNLRKGRLFNKGRTPWNKGKTKYNDERMQDLSKKLKIANKKRFENHIPTPKNSNLTYEVLYSCIFNKKMTRKQAADFIGTTERLVKKWKQIWKIKSLNDGRIKKGQRLSPETEFKKDR